MKKTTHHKWVALVLALIFSLAFTTAPALAEQAQPKQNQLDMFKFLSRTKLDLSAYKGKALFLNFFTEWCPYCMTEMPDIQEIHETYSGDELEVILIHVWDGEDGSASDRIREKYGLENLTFFEDENMLVARTVGIPGYPTSLFIDQEGYLVKAIPSALNFEQISEILDDMGVALAQAQETTDATAPPPTLAPATESNP